MSHSNSSLNCFASCMAKYEHSYILRTPPCKPTSPHLTFGTMAHDVLYKAGKLRDEVNDGVVDKEAYYNIIPSELLYDDLKVEFGIPNWTNYFTDVIKQVAKYEEQLKNEMFAMSKNPATIEREVKLQLTVDMLEQLGFYGISQPVVGVIDLLMYDGEYATILDYKFSASRKTQDDFDMNSQLPLYALFVHYIYDIPLHNIKYGYIDIPKKAADKPIVLKNGTLSRSKDQNITQEFYEKAVIAIHGDDDYYNCKFGGYYFDVWCNLAHNKPAYLSVQWLDIDVYVNVTKDLMQTAQMIDKMRATGMPFLHKYDAYSCKSCEYVNACKPWITVGG